MRIRKHAKISPLHYYASSSSIHGAVLQTPHLCQLNQSPWDVITFPDEENNINQQSLLPPPPPAPAPSYSYQLDGYDSYAVNGTFYDSEQSITSMKLDDSRDMKKMNSFDNNVPADSDDFEKDEQDEEMVDGNNNNITTICCKNDGKGWQCSREANGEHYLCEHHFAQVKKHCSSTTTSNSAHSTTTAAAANCNTKMKQAEPTPSSRGRPHRPKKSSSSEYYYYSGFGPLWGKKRSGPSTGKKNNVAAAAAAEIYSSDSTTHGAQSSSSQMDNEGFDYVEDDDDEDEEEVENCKLIKRARKPIKARSLKSLM